MPVNDLANLGDIREFAKWYLESEEEGSTTLWPDPILDGFIAAEHRHLATKVILAHEGFWRRSSTTDIVANQELYEQPTDFRNLNLLEYRTAAGENSWREIRPLAQPRGRKEYHSPDGVGINQGSITDLIQGNRAADIRYHFVDNFLVLVPFFNQSMTAGLRQWYDYSPAGPTDETWIPFGDGTLSLLRDHHEILAVGAVIRGKEREEVTDYVTNRYLALWRLLADAADKRQTQENPHGADLEGLE